MVDARFVVQLGTARIGGHILSTSEA